MRNPINEMKVTSCKDAVAAGSTDVTDAGVIDMQDYEGCLFIFSLGAITSGAATSVGVSSKVTNAPTPGTDDLLGSHITVLDTDDDKTFMINVYKPQFRYLRPWVKRATQNAVVNSIHAVQYGAKKVPVTQDTSIKSTLNLISPAIGTA